MRLMRWVKLTGTNRSLQLLYRAFNRAYFDNRLPEVTVKFSPKPLRGCMGFYSEEKELIVISSVLRRWRRTTCMVLLHEMAHVATPGKQHGAAFQRVMMSLAKIGAFRQLW